MGKAVLAMYDVRGKQEFIFRTNKMKEIIGGSLVIRDVFADYLYTSALDAFEKDNNKGIYSYKQDDNSDFTEAGWLKHLADGYIGEVIYDGGGNFFVLYESKDVLLDVNKLFFKRILENIGTLRVLCSYVEIDNFNNFKEDEKRLRIEHRKNENAETIIRPVNTIPFVQIDSKTSQPIIHTDISEIRGKNIPVKTTLESYAKYKKWSEANRQNPELYGETVLDKLVEEKGKDSMLAVIFIDGNNMGAQVSRCLDRVSDDYEASVKALRQFSNDIQTHYVDETKANIEKKLKNRMVVFAGDEMSFVCKAADAMKAVEAYFEVLRNDEERSSCAGIALFHSHAPYYEAYKIAEECCESGKQLMKKQQETNTCYVDYQYCQGGLGMSLDEVRLRETKNLCSKPWLIAGNSQYEVFTFDEVKKIVAAMNTMNARTNVKGLVAAAKDSLQTFDMEMERIYAHMSDEIRKDKLVKYLFEELSGERRQKYVYDIGIVYDQWFKASNNSQIAEEESNDN